ncbi:MAG: autotransporter assembly complex family protein [Caulobacteraceae bacterium]
MGRTGCALAASWAVTIGLAAPAVLAAEPKAAVTGDLDRSLRKEIETAIGETKSRPDSRIDARRRARDAAGDAIALLRSEGYYEATAEPDVSDTEPPAAIVRVTLGARFHFQAATVAWQGGAPPPEIAKAGEEAAHLDPGAPGRAADVLAAEGRIVAALQKLGYADAAIRPREVVVDYADRSVNPAFKIAAGDRVRLDGVKVITKGRTRPAWVRALAPWKRGDVYSPDAVAKLERRLIDAGVYDSVSVSLAPKDQATKGPAGTAERPVLVSLSDRPPRTLELGAGYSTTEGSGVDGKYFFYDRLGRADTLTLTARLYDIQQKLDLELDLPDWRRPDQTLRIGGGPVADRTAAYDDAGGGVRLDVDRHFTKTTYITLGGAFDYAATREKTAVNLLATPVGVDLKLFITTGLAAFALDRSNDPLDPTRGWRLEARTQPTWITGDRRLVYLETDGQVSGYLPLDSTAATVIAGRLKLGAILGGSIPDVPADRRFYAGGGGSVRGYGYQAVGPRLIDNTPEGGLSLIETSFEVRRRLTRQFGAVAFVDAGTVGSGTTPDFRNVSVGVGVGVRYNLGFGPFRLDIATPLNPRPGDGRVQVYISIGQAF